MILRAVIGLAGLLFVVLALGFLHDPAAAAARLGVGPLGPLGQATLRGDFFAFFAVGGLLSIAGAVRDDARLLLAPLLLIALTLAGRLITVAVSGFDPAMGPPMAVEAVMIALLWFGRRSLGRAKQPSVEHRERETDHVEKNPDAQYGHRPRPDRRGGHCGRYPQPHSGRWRLRGRAHGPWASGPAD